MNTARVGLDMDVRTSKMTPAPGANDDGLVALSYLLSGVVFYGGLGWAGAHYLGHQWMLPVGLVLGVTISLYLVIRRYTPTASTGDQSSKKEQ